MDQISGKSYEHRRGWIAERMQQLATVFAVDVAAYEGNKRTPTFP